MPAWTAATSSGESGRVRLRPSTSAAKQGPIWRSVTAIAVPPEGLVGILAPPGPARLTLPRPPRTLRRDAGAAISRRVRLGHGDVRAPGGRRQLEQRLVGVGAHVGLAVPGAERRRLRPLAPLSRGHPPVRRSRLRCVSILARVEPDRARGG